MKNQVETPKQVKITPTIAKILAQRIIKELQELRIQSTKSNLEKVNKEIKSSAEYKKAMAIDKELEKLNKSFSTKFDKYIKPGYKGWQFGRVRLVEVLLNQNSIISNIPTLYEDQIKNDILMEATFGNAKSAEEIVQNYIKKYTKA